MDTKPIYTIQDILNMDLPPVIVYAIPAMLALTLLEWFLSYRENKDAYEGKDFWACVVVGIGVIVSSAAVKLVQFAIILYFYNIVPWYIGQSWLGWIGCFIAVDFLRYWAHRVSHEQRVWWATHITHHSSEHYNFSVTFRLSWIQHVKVIFFIPIALMGFDPFVFFICNQIAVLYQFWLHTELINKVHPIIEYIFVTPSHHRVHHGRDDKYLDRNYGSALIIWDRMFGTFQAEEERPNYGITVPVESFNPVYIVFHELIAWLQDLGRVRSLKDAWTVTFGSPGAAKEWRDQYEAKHGKIRPSIFERGWTKLVRRLKLKPEANT
jgi:sterol desaturase/sphingolipid hydroxylase (fatty acid hydroxylase superfamily)